MVSIRYLLRREVVGEVSTTPSPAFECDAVLAGSHQALLHDLMGHVRQLLQFLDQARPAAFTHPNDRNARVVDVVQFEIAVGMHARNTGGCQRPGRSTPNDRYPSQGFAARVYHPKCPSLIPVGRTCQKAQFANCKQLRKMVAEMQVRALAPLRGQIRPLDSLRNERSFRTGRPKTVQFAVKLAWHEAQHANVTQRDDPPWISSFFRAAKCMPQSLEQRKNK